MVLPVGDSFTPWAHIYPVTVELLLGGLRQFAALQTHPRVGLGRILFALSRLVALRLCQLGVSARE